MEACNNFHLPKRDWTVNVTTYGWTVGFAGAFTGDKLTDPVFSLRPGKQVAADGTTADGFFVERRKGSEDSVKLGAATMIHLFYSDPNKFRLGPSLTWAPLTFGLGIGDSSQARRESGFRRIARRRGPRATEGPTWPFRRSGPVFGSAGTSAGRLTTFSRLALWPVSDRATAILRPRAAATRQPNKAQGQEQQRRSPGSPFPKNRSQEQPIAAL